MNPILFVLALFFSGLCSLAAADYARRRRTGSGKSYFVLLMTASAVWSIAYAFELISPNLRFMMWFTRIEYLGIATIPVLWLLLVLRHTGQEKWLSPRAVGFFMIIPVLTLLMLITNGWHQWFYRSITLDVTGPFLMQSFDRGPWYWVHVGYSYLCLLSGFVLLWNQSVHSARTYRWQARILLAGVLLPWAVNVSYVLGFRPFSHADATPIAFTISGMVMAWGMFHYRLFDLAPIARSQAVEGMAEALLIFDVHYRLVDANPKARELIGTGARGVGGFIWEVLIAWPELVQLCEGGEATTVEISRKEGDEEHMFVASVSLLSTRRGKTLGRVLMIRDITELRHTQAELESSQESLKDAVKRLQKQNRDLKEALARIKRLEGLLPICSYCKKIRDDRNYWREVEHYIGARTDAKFSHGICPDCMTKFIEPKLKEMRKKDKR